MNASLKVIHHVLRFYCKNSEIFVRILFLRIAVICSIINSRLRPDLPTSVNDIEISSFICEGFIRKVSFKKTLQKFPNLQYVLKI